MARIIRFDEKIKAPGFTLKNLNGDEVKLEDLRGKAVFLNFWATWCPPCRLEMPSMQKLYTEFKDKDFAMLAIDLQETTRKVSTYLVDREGYLVGSALGARDWASKKAFALIDHLLSISSDS